MTIEATTQPAGLRLWAADPSATAYGRRESERRATGGSSPGAGAAAGDTVGSLLRGDAVVRAAGGRPADGA